MKRISGFTSWLLGSLGGALLVLSILLVPENRAFGQTTPAPPVCDGIMTCLTLKCSVLNPNCPDSCTDGTNDLCKCKLAPDSCKDCICKEGTLGSSCDCLPPS